VEKKNATKENSVTKENAETMDLKVIIFVSKTATHVAKDSLIIEQINFTPIKVEYECTFFNACINFTFFAKITNKQKMNCRDNIRYYLAPPKKGFLIFH
jgi:hypothetical protein